MQRRSFELLIHLFCWGLFILFPFILGLPAREGIIFNITFHSILLAIFFYTNSELLVPKLLTKKKIWLYILSVLGIMVLIILANYGVRHFFNWDFREIAENPRRHRNPLGREISRTVLSSIFIVAASTSYRLLANWFKDEQKLKELEKEKLSSELSFLKSQVSPHFLFNTLNNIYSLSITNSEAAPGAIMKLSQLLRYMLYESNDQLVLLSKEIEYLENYIDLQKMRLKKDMQIELVKDGNFSGHQIEPMLLIPFIENAFKHGVDSSQRSTIKIHISVSGKTLDLKVENPRFEKSTKDPDSGIGLANVQRRLDLLYPGSHKLVITQTDSIYTSELKMQLK